MNQFKYSRHLKQKGYNRHNIVYGLYGLKVCKNGYINKNQLLYIQQYIGRFSKKFILRVTLNRKITKKSLETRMGGGKGPIINERFYVKKGSIILEIWDISFELMSYFLKLINNKVNLKLKLLKIL